MTEWIQSVIESVGYLGVGFLTFIENVFPPIPSEIIIPFSGFTARVGELGIVGVIIAGSLGSLIGALPLYYLGYALGPDRVYKLADKYLKYIGFEPRDLERGMEWMNNHGRWAVFLCRMVPGLRSVISIPAGINQMNMGVFLLLTAAGSTIWTALLALAGYALGSNYESLRPVLDTASYIVFGGLVIWYLWHIGRRLLSSDEQKEMEHGT